MTVRIGADGVIELVGRCPSEDAETLLQHLSTHPKAEVDWRECESAHTAVIQVLLAADLSPRGPPMNKFLADMVEPQLRQR